jgi:PhnB protein
MKNETSVDPTPKMYHSVTPYLIVENAKKALDFYEKALQAKIISKIESEPGKIVHAEIKIGDSIIMLAENSPEMRLYPQTGEYRSVSFMVYVPDVDLAAEVALSAGMKLMKEVRDQFYGDRTGTFEDPFGHVWTLGTHVEDVNEDELKNRMERIFS